jgi:hypothetical protein
MRSVFSLFVIVAAALVFAAAFAHENHDHGKVMGTVKSVDAKSNTIQIETTDDKAFVCKVDAVTRFLRGDKAAAFADVKAGTRVVVTMNHAVTPPVASEVRLAPAPAGAAPRPPEHDNSSTHRH